MDMKIFLLISLAVTLGYGLLPPKRCCSPDIWQADIIETGFMYMGSVLEQVYYRMAYDWTKKRWALAKWSLDEEGNRKKFVNMIFDHGEDAKYLVTGKGCIEAENYAIMQQYCALDNATYLDYAAYGLDDKRAISYTAWFYDFIIIPRRAGFKLSNKNCLPLQEGSYSLVQNSFALTKLKPDPCVPWEEPEKVRNNTCYMSTEIEDLHKGGTQATGHMGNMKFTNLKLNITDEEMFNIPNSCLQKLKWPKKFKIDELQRHFTWRFKKY
eukprot:GHVU01051333.1.p1 GENE.GHVU01051333.1~~GHVU01051333.1.p1  ORF type:complete len:268 (+),score=29.89 GHVU01051333.1:139-942(+)